MSGLYHSFHPKIAVVWAGEGAVPGTPAAPSLKRVGDDMRPRLLFSGISPPMFCSNTSSGHPERARLLGRRSRHGVPHGNVLGWTDTDTVLGPHDRLRSARPSGHASGCVQLSNVRSPSSAANWHLAGRTRVQEPQVAAEGSSPGSAPRACSAATVHGETRCNPPVEARMRHDEAGVPDRRCKHPTKRALPAIPEVVSERSKSPRREAFC